MQEYKMGDEVELITISDRKVSGTLLDVYPGGIKVKEDGMEKTYLISLFKDSISINIDDKILRVD